MKLPPLWPPSASRRRRREREAEMRHEIDRLRAEGVQFADVKVRGGLAKHVRREG